MEPEAMVSVDLLSDDGMFKPARVNLPRFERFRYASRPFSSIFSMDAVDRTSEPGSLSCGLTGSLKKNCEELVPSVWS
jgi:hypothetical protein